jgi:hypothetical protein
LPTHARRVYLDDTTVEDKCYETCRFEACVDWAAHHALVNRVSRRDPWKVTTIMDEPGWAWEECIGDDGAATAAQVAGDTALLACALQRLARLGPREGSEKPEGSARSSYRKQRRLNEKQVVNTLDAVLPPCVSRPPRLISER